MTGERAGSAIGVCGGSDDGVGSGRHGVPDGPADHVQPAAHRPCPAARGAHQGQGTHCTGVRLLSLMMCYH